MSTILQLLMMKMALLRLSMFKSSQRKMTQSAREGRLPRMGRTPAVLEIQFSSFSVCPLTHQFNIAMISHYNSYHLDMIKTVIEKHGGSSHLETIVENIKIVSDLIFLYPSIPNPYYSEMAARFFSETWWITLWSCRLQESCSSQL